MLLFALASAGLLITEELNQSLFFLLNAFLNRLPEFFWINITNLGSTLAGAALLCLLLPKRPQLAAHLLLFGLLCTLTIYGFKHGLDVVRPHLVLDRGLFYFIETNITSPARPSGHTATGFFIAGTAWIFLRSKALKLGVLLLACLIGLSRVAIGVHWPLDLLWGALIGFGMGYFGVLITSYRTALSAIAITNTDKRFNLLSIGMISFIAVYFLVNPLPYPEENLLSYIIVYSVLAYSILRCLQELRL